jgi:HD-GYP domain-containing protein (c-di-GMP phosphodiesterase class II)
MGDSPLDKLSAFVGKIVEGRDPDLGGHLSRVGKCVIPFGQVMGCSSAEIEVLALGARIHDLGKLSISESILNKPARLTEAEFSLIRQHPAIGKELLVPLGLDSRVSEIVHCHHENYDGSGYPQGLAGEAIPFLARIVRVWDSYDALTMDRPYHEGVSSNGALNILQRDERFYDSSILKTFCRFIRRGGNS